MNSEPSKLIKLVVPALERIIKNASWRKHQKLVADCKALMEWMNKNPHPGAVWQPPTVNLQSTAIAKHDSYRNPFDEDPPVAHPPSLSLPSGLFDDGGRLLNPIDTERILYPLHAACQTLAAKVVEPALDCFQKMIAYHHLRGEMDSEIDRPESKMLAAVMETVTKCYDIADEGVELLVLKTMLSAVTSASLRVHGECLLKAVRTCYNIYLGSKVPVNQTTAKASLTQMLVIVLRRMEADSSTVPVQPIVVADMMEPTERAAADSNAQQFVQSFITRVVQDIEQTLGPSGLSPAAQRHDGAFDLMGPAPGASPADGSFAEDREMMDAQYWDGGNRGAGRAELGGAGVGVGGTPGLVGEAGAAAAAAGGVGGAGGIVAVNGEKVGGVAVGDILPDVDMEKEGDTDVKISNKLRRDAFLVFRALCKLSMKQPPAEGGVDPFAVRGKMVSLELLKICLENSGAVFRTNER